MIIESAAAIKSIVIKSTNAIKSTVVNTVVNIMVNIMVNTAAVNIITNPKATIIDITTKTSANISAAKIRRYRVMTVKSTTAVNIV